MRPLLEHPVHRHEGVLVGHGCLVPHNQLGSSDERRLLALRLEVAIRV